MLSECLARKVHLKVFYFYIVPENIDNLNELSLELLIQTESKLPNTWWLHRWTANNARIQIFES